MNIYTIGLEAYLRRGFYELYMFIYLCCTVHLQRLIFGRFHIISISSLDASSIGRSLCYRGRSSGWETEFPNAAYHFALFSNRHGHAARLFELGHSLVARHLYSYSYLLHNYAYDLEQIFQLPFAHSRLEAPLKKYYKRLLCKSVNNCLQSSHLLW